MRRESQQRRIREKAYQRGINASYLEGDDDDDENAISLSAIKKQFKGGKRMFAIRKKSSDNAKISI